MNSEAFRSGQVAGALLGTGLLLLGAAWCAVIARRRTASAACVYGLGLVLLGWAVVTVPRTAGVVSPGVELPAPVFYVLSFALILAGGVSAVVGLVLYSRSPHYRQGKRQAIAALVIVGILGVIFFIGALWRAAQILEERRDAAGAQSAPAEPIVNQELNFTFRPPGRPWVSWDAKKVNAAVTFGLMRARPQTFFMVIAETGLDDMETAGLVSIAQANLQSAADQAQISDEIVRPASGLDGTRFYADVKRGAHSLTYVFWVHARGGYGYQLITFGKQSDRDAVRRAADELIAGFRLIDPGRTHEAEKPVALGAYRSDDLGVAGALGPGWFESKQRATNNPEAAWGGWREGGGGFLVTPLVFEGPTQPRLEAVTQAVLKEWDIAYPSAEFTEVRPVERWGLRGHRLRYARAVDKVDYDYRFEVLTGRGHGVFVASWAHRGEPALDEWAQGVAAGLRVARPRLTAEQLPPPQRAYQARVHNRLGLFAYEARDYRQAVPLFQVAVRLDPGDPAYLQNTMDAFSRSGQPKEGLAYLQALTHPTRQDDKVRSWEAWLLKESGRRDEALAIYGPLFAGSHRDDEDFEAYATLLAAAGRFDDFKRAHDKYLAGQPSPRLRRTQARLLGQAGRDADALAVLDALRSTSGFDAELAWARVPHLRALDRHRERIAVCEELIRNGFASYDAYYEKGDAETSLHWYQRAKASFEEALKQKPADADAKDYLQHVSGLLGEGNNSAVKDAVEPVPLPTVLAGRLAAPPPAGEGSRYVHWVDGFAFRKGVEARTTSRRRILVADQAGVERFSTLEVNFDPLFEAVYVNELTVRDAHGKVVAKGQPSDYYVVDKQGDLATHDKTLFVPVPGLAVGHEVHFAVTRRERGAPQAFGYRALRLGSDLAIGLRAAYFLGDARAIRHRASGGLRPEDVPGGLLWKLENVSPQPLEPLQPRAHRVQAELWLGDAAADWPTLGREYLSSIESKLAPAPATEALARRLTKGRTDRQLVLDQVAAHVHRDYVYKALEFGRRGRIPNAPPVTIRSRFGDCKDHAVLMQGLLRASGVTSHLALVSTDDDVQADVPSLDQFNHMVLFVPAAAGAPARFYDATDKGIDPRLSPPLGLAGRSALVLDPAQPRFERIAAYAPHSSRVRVVRGVTLDRGPDIAVTEKVEIDGYFSASLRDHLSTLDARGQREWAQRVVSSGARGARLKSLAVANVGDASKPLVMDAVYTLHQQCSADATGLRCPLATPWESYYLEAEAVTDRRTPFELNYPLDVSSSTTVRGDTCGRLLWETRPAAGKAEFASWTVKDSVQDRSASLALDVEVVPGTFTASRYDEYVRQMDLAIRSVARSVTCAP